MAVDATPKPILFLLDREFEDGQLPGQRFFCRHSLLLEGALCGLITLALVPLLEWMGLPQGMATFAGGMVGFMGVEKLRGYSDVFMSRKAQG